MVNIDLNSCLLKTNMESDETLGSKLINCYTQQLSEIELLSSMYPNKEDILFTDNNVLSEIKNFVDNKSKLKPNHLDFTLILHIHGLKLEISINLPSFYPDVEPNIYLRCNQLNRQQESTLNTDLSIYVKDNHFGAPCLYTAISWIQDNIETYSNKIIQPTTSTGGKPKDKNKEKFVRFWIYSHHIYSKKKREEITKMAKEYNLTGFCLPGKPGIICVEGPESECNEWWKIIKNMNWKKIAIRKSEIFDLSNQIEEQRFDNFEEINANMSEFSKYMEQCDLIEAFNEFFGLCNNT